MRKWKRILAFAASILIFVALSAITVNADNIVHVSTNSLYRYTLDENQRATILSYFGTESDVIVNRIDGRYAVVEIASGAFAANESIKNIELYPSVKKIGADAFYGATSLTSVKLRSGTKLEEIGDRAFAGCKSLTGFKLPASLKSIGKEAFLGCTSAVLDFENATGLVSLGDYALSFSGASATEQVTVHLPENLTEIGDGVFYGCLNIKAFEIPDTNPRFSSHDGILFSKDGSVLEIYPAAKADGSFTVPGTVKRIAGSAFAGTALESVTVSEGVTEIGGSAFYGASKLKTVSLPSALQTIGSYAFLDCTALTDIALPDSLSDIGSFLFRGCLSLANVTLPKALTEIPDGMFDSCTSLVTVELPASITKIGQFAFNHCISLSSIDLGDSVNTIRSYAFRGCIALTEIHANKVQTIDAFAFQDCRKLAKADISGVETVSAYLFGDCPLLKEVVLSEKLRAIGNYAFYGCDMLAKLTLPQGLEKIGDYAFAGCAALTEIVIPASAKALGCGVFYGSGVTSVTVLSPLRVLPVSFFDGCKKLSYVSLPETLESISASAFADCSSLSRVLAEGRTVKHVAFSAFTGCRRLENVIVGTEDHEIGIGTFYGCDALTDVTLPEGITHIGISAFGNCVNLATVTLPASLDTLDDAAFTDCVKIASLTLPESLTTIGSSVFYGATKLAELTIPKSVTFVGTDAFYGTRYLRNKSGDFVVVGDGVLVAYTGNDSAILIPETVKRIPAYRFESIKTLTSVTIPSSVQIIAKNAFAALVYAKDSSGNEVTYHELRYLTIVGWHDTYAEVFADHAYYTFRDRGK